MKISAPTSFVSLSDTKCPNQFPSTTATYRIAVIGEAPGELEEAYGRPFVGPSGKMLGHVLEQVSLSRDKVFLGNLAQHRPPNNEFGALPSKSREDGIAILTRDIAHYDPHVVILLGNWPLHAAGVQTNISAYRGTVFLCADPSSPFVGRKCISTFHPASLLHGSYANLPIIIADFQRALLEARSPEIKSTERTYELSLSALEICGRIDDILRSGRDCLVSFDIEGGLSRLPCCSISTDAGSAFIIAFDNGSESHFTLEDEVLVWTALSRMLYDERVRKCLQNSLYDRFVLAYRYRILIRNITEDTMLKHWELFCEFEKGLAFQASYYTNEPYYKSERKAQSNQEFWTYCCKDSAITKEICDKQDTLLKATELPYANEHYRFNMALLDIFLYLEIRGIRYDSAKARSKSISLQSEIYKLQHRINVAVMGPDYLNGAKILETVCVKKRGDIRQAEDVVVCCRAAYRSVALRIGVLLAESSKRHLTDEEKGELSFIAGIHFNCESSQQKADYLFRKRKFPEQRHRQTRQLTTNYEALLNIYKKTDDKVVGDMILITSLLTRVQMLRIRADDDGRIRCGYNIVGAETGRITCYTSPTGSGYNLQTIPNEDRDLYLADIDRYIFQCDLAGADAWTVACWCNRMGDSTMLDDLLAGLKVAKLVALMFLRGPEISKRSREELSALCAEIKKDDPIYFGSKCVQHATNYDAQPPTISATIFIQSEGQTNIPAAECRILQTFYNRRYPGLQRWKNFAQNQLIHVGRITAASGHTRIFYGNRRDHHTFKQFLAHEPQANTTFVTNLAALRMWKDPQNRDSSGRLVIEPLHQVHDALLGQFPIAQTDDCCQRIGDYFNNPITIAGCTITIPFEGSYGTSWKETTAGTIRVGQAKAPVG